MVRKANITPKFVDQQWSLIDDHFDKKTNRTWETLFSLGNGYIGMRGSFEEGLGSFSTEGTFINGFYDTFPLHYPEKFYGYAETDQLMLNVANARVIRLQFQDGETYNPLTGTISDFYRKLDLRAGVLVREMTWESPRGKRMQLKTEQLASFQRRRLIALRLTITPENFDDDILIESIINYKVQRNVERRHDPRSAAGLDNIDLVVEGQEVADGGAFLFQRTRNTQLTLACGLRNMIHTENVVGTHPINNQVDNIGTLYTVSAVAGEPVVFDKYSAYCTSIDTRPDDLHETVRDELDVACELGFDALCTEQRDYLDAFWNDADITIEGDDWLQGAIRFNMFHLLQSAGRNGYTSVPAKGLTGQGYNGHYFWDTEAYMLPFFLHTRPVIARRLLEYRYHTLRRARRRAREMALRKGALFPWRTINGTECSANPPTGTAQYHINADIAYAVKRFFEATGDEEFMRDEGAELVFETARMWYELGAFIPTRGGAFCIHGVTGPDEYTTLVDNNTYTNLMARENLTFAFEIAQWLREHFPEHFQRLSAKIELEADEPSNWQRAAQAMYIPKAVDVGTAEVPNYVIPQDDSFLYKPRWELTEASPEDEPLLLNYHPLVYNRYQVCKQADLILAEVELGHLPLFSKEQKRRDFDYYDAVTTHDSSLSLCIFSILAAELAAPTSANDPYLRIATEYYRASASIDLEDHRNETHRGIHAASMGGSWLGIVFGFAQMRTDNNRLSFSPVMPLGWESYTVRVYFQNRRIAVQVGPGRDDRHYPRVALHLLEGEPLDVEVYGEMVRAER